MVRTRMSIGDYHYQGMRAAAAAASTSRGSGTSSVVDLVETPHSHGLVSGSWPAETFSLPLQSPEVDRHHQNTNVKPYEEGMLDEEFVKSMCTIQNPIIPRFFVKQENGTFKFTIDENETSEEQLFHLPSVTPEDIIVQQGTACDEKDPSRMFLVDSTGKPIAFFGGPPTRPSYQGNGELMQQQFQTEKSLVYYDLEAHKYVTGSDEGQNAVDQGLPIKRESVLVLPKVAEEIGAGMSQDFSVGAAESNAGTETFMERSEPGAFSTIDMATLSEITKENVRNNIEDRTHSAVEIDAGIGGVLGIQSSRESSCSGSSTSSSSPYEEESVERQLVDPLKSGREPEGMADLPAPKTNQELKPPTMSLMSLLQSSTPLPRNHTEDPQVPFKTWDETDAESNDSQVQEMNQNPFKIPKRRSKVAYTSDMSPQLQQLFTSKIEESVRDIQPSESFAQVEAQGQDTHWSRSRGGSSLKNKGRMSDDELAQYGNMLLTERTILKSTTEQLLTRKLELTARNSVLMAKAQQMGLGPLLEKFGVTTAAMTGRATVASSTLPSASGFGFTSYSTEVSASGWSNASYGSNSWGNSSYASSGSSGSGSSTGYSRRGNGTRSFPSENSFDNQHRNSSKRQKK